MFEALDSLGDVGRSGGSGAVRELSRFHATVGVQAEKCQVLIAKSQDYSLHRIVGAHVLHFPSSPPALLPLSEHTLSPPLRAPRGIVPVPSIDLSPIVILTFI